jgi:hydroxypyruvate reductase
MVVSPAPLAEAPAGLEPFVGGHPVPPAGSVAAGRRALEIAASAAEDDVLVVLLSGGASALLEVPADGVSLEELRAATDRLLRAGADIAALNAVRKHLSAIKGGRLAAAAAGRTLALAISDVVGDDLSVIASGPTVGDPTTYRDAMGVLERFGGTQAFPRSVVAVLDDGARGGRADTPKPSSASLARAATWVVGALGDALDGARREARARGYDVEIEPAPVTGEARAAALGLIARVCRPSPAPGRTRCLLSGGETTVTVIGSGRGGRNQELALALATPLARRAAPAVVASVGTDGIDGPTDAAGAIVDHPSAGRARSAGLGEPEAYLRNNDAYTFFHALGDLVVTGPTGTNVGDLQVVMLPGDVHS